MTDAPENTPPRWLNAPVLLAGAATALSLFGDQALYVILPTAPEAFGLTGPHAGFMIGAVLSANRWVRLATNHLAERLVHTMHPTWLLVAALGLGACLGVSFGLVKIFWLFLLARGLWGLCWSFIRQIGVMTAMDASAPGDKGKAVGLFNGLTWLGAAVAMALSGFLYRQVGLQWTFVILGGSSLLALLPGALSRQSLHGRHSEFRSPAGDPQPGHVVPLLACALLLNMATGAVIATVGYVLRALAGETMTLAGVLLATVEATGLLLMLRNGIDVLAGPFLGALTDWIGHRVGAPLFFGVAALVSLAAVLVPTIPALAALLLVFFVCATTLAVLLAAEAGRAGSKTFARYASAVDLGAALGPLLVWDLLGRFRSPHVPFVVAASVCAAAAAFALVWALRTPPRPIPQP